MRKNTLNLRVYLTPSQAPSTSNRRKLGQEVLEENLRGAIFMIQHLLGNKFAIIFMGPQSCRGIKGSRGSYFFI